MNDVHNRLLRSIEKHDGVWGWYQLDRVINPRDLPVGSTVMDILRLLEADGLIVQSPGDPQNKFSITDAGRAALSQATS